MKQQKSTGHVFRRLITTIGLMLMTAATVHANYQDTVLADNPLAYYALNPGSDPAGISPDLSGNGNDGTAMNVTAVPGPSPYIANAAYFDGTNSAVDLSGGNNPGLLDFSGPITLEAWVQPASPSWFGNIVAKGYDSGTYQEITLRVNGPYGADYFGTSGSAGVSGGAQTTNWAYVVLASDGTYCSLYVNGTLVQRTGDTTGSIVFSDSWQIGNGSSAGASRYFYGNIGQVAVYNYGLTSDQVLAHYYAGELNSTPSNSPPIITAQPQPQSAYVGGSATFSVSVVSAFATTNQWYKNSVPLAGQTNSSLTLTSVSAGDAVNYSVVVGNGMGITNSVAASLSLLSSGNSLRWSSTGNNGLWDNATSANWLNLANSLTTVFNSGDQVLFDDTIGEPTTVSVNGTVTPSSITINSSSNNFTINGSGTISGAGSLVKTGLSTLTIVSGANFTGPVSISGGLVYAGNNSFASVNSITITNNSTLDIGGGPLIGNKPVSIAGLGFNGRGAIFNSYADYPLNQLNITLAGDSRFGASARWDLATGSQISGGHSLTIDWSAGAGYGEWNSVAIGANVTGIALTNGNIGMKGMDNSFQNPGTIFTVSTNCQLVFYSGGFNGSIHVLSGGFTYLWTAPAPFNGNTIVLEGGAQWESFYNSGDEPVNSAVTLNGVAHVVVGDHNMLYTNLISGPGGFVFDYYNHQMVLSASNTYSGPTIVGDGQKVALSGNGSITHSSPIFFGGANPTSTHLDVSARPDQTLTLSSGQILGGIGLVNGSLIVSAGATLAPAGTNTTIGITVGANAVGTLAANGDMTLNGTTILKLNGSGTNDMLQASGTINYGGTLNLVNITGAPLAAGDGFQIANAPAYSGSFAKITPTTPGSGLAWDLTQLNSGFVNVVAVPVVNSTQISGNNLIFSGTGGLVGGTYYVLMSTNLTTPIGNWVPLQTNVYDASGAFNVTNAITPGIPRQFYQIKQ